MRGGRGPLTLTLTLPLPLALALALALTPTSVALCVEEETLTTRPAGAARSTGSSSWMSRWWPRWLLPMESSHPCASSCRVACMQPALQTSASRPPG